MKRALIILLLDYYFIGTLFLLLYFKGDLTITSRDENTSEIVVRFVVLGLCFYWPLLIYKLWKGRDNDENS